MVVPSGLPDTLSLHSSYRDYSLRSQLLDLPKQKNPPVRIFVVPSGLEPDRALKNCPVGNFSEGARLPRWPSDPEEYEIIIILP